MQANKNKQLGMNHSTARARLLKLVVVDLLKATGQDQCYKCGKPLDADSWSLEHKQPWLHVSPALFWDLSNVTFSHKACNKPDRPGNIRRIGPEGTAWCSRCLEFKDKNLFHKNASVWKGVHNRCIPCRQLMRKRWGKSSKTVDSPS